MDLRSRKMQRLVMLIEDQVVGMLVANDLAKLPKNADRRFSNIKLTDKALGKLGISDHLVTEEYIKELRHVFPAGKKGTQDVVRDKLNDFLDRNPEETLDRIKQATEMYVQRNSEFCGKANNFIYKETTKRGVFESRLKEALEQMDEEDTHMSNSGPTFGSNVL